MATFFLSETSWCVKDAFALPSSCLRSGFVPLGGEKAALQRGHIAPFRADELS